MDQHRLVVAPNDTPSTIDLKKLSKNIEAMVEKIADLSCIQANSKRRMTKYQDIFRFGISREISVIKKSEE